MFALRDPEFEALLPEIAHRLRAEFGKCSIYLFGSRAEGRARPESDIDLLVVLPQATESNTALAGRAYTALGSIHAPMDILVYTAGQFAERSTWDGSLEASVVRKGRLLHAA